MQRKCLDDMVCPVARTIEQVGEWWSMLILRDALAGLTRFDEFLKSLGIAPNMLTRRLNALVESELLERRQYSARPPRFEYLPTERTQEFRPILWAMMTWGNKYYAPEGPAVLLEHKKTGKIAEPILVDRVSGKPMTEQDFHLVCGPAATESLRERLLLLESRRAGNPPVEASPKKTSASEKSVKVKRSVATTGKAKKKSVKKSK